MRAQVLQNAGERVFAVVFDKGDEFIDGLLQFAQEHQLDAAEIAAIGAFSRATLGYFDRERLEYHEIPIDEQVEVLSLLGNIALNQESGEPKIHAHVVVGRADGTTRGGHVMEAHVWPTLEVIVTESPRHLRRRSDRETGLALLVPRRDQQ